MVQMTIEVPEGVLASLHKDPAMFAKDLRMAAAAKWYELRLVSQARAAEIACVSRAEFLDSLSRFGVTPFQYEDGELVEEVRGG